MSIKSQGGVFGRNPTFATLTVENGISVGSLTVGGETITGLSYQGAWNANTNTPDITASPAQGQFWIVSVDGSTNVGGITNWTTGDWALYDGSSWQRVEGGNTDLSSGVTGQLAVANGGTGASDAATARTNLSAASAAQGALADTALQPADIGVSVQGYDATILTSSDIGSTVQGYDATILTSSDIGSSIQAYDADTAKTDVSNTFTANQVINANLTVDTNTLHVDATNNLVGIGEASPAAGLHVRASTGDIYQRWQRLSGQYIDITQTSGGSDIKSYGKSLNIGDYGGFGVYFRQNGLNRMSLETSGNVKIQNNLEFNSGNGIDFSATSGTGTSELLDDYEEGTWSGAITDGTTDKTFTGYYTKIGNTVYIRGGKENIQQSGTALSGTIYVTGLPYSVTYSAVIALRQNYMATTTIFQGVASSTTIRFYNQSSATSDNVQMSSGNINTYTDLSFSGVYLTS
jgi:hypothetical protein